MRKVVTIGGGTGHSQLLKALKMIPSMVITGVCPSTDSGGSTGLLQKKYDGGGYTGDLTKCIAALSQDEVLAEALLYRYEDGLLSHPVKNLLFHALEKVAGTERALGVMWSICGLGPHRILPVTLEKTELCATLKLGNTIIGETNIDQLAKNALWSPTIHSISNIFLRPQVNASPAVTQALEVADWIIVAPGDLYSSIIPVLLPRGMKASIQKSRARVILVLNILTKRGETDRYTATDFVERVEGHIGRAVDYIFYNSAPIPKQTLLLYSLEEKVALGGFSNAKDQRVIQVPMAKVSDTGQVYSDAFELRRAIEALL